VSAARYQTKNPGGHGAVREVCDLFEKYHSGVQGSEVQGLPLI
jgi:3-deoxy-D-manno-octulosonate 8-phosphate phosphatase KdsC-like HAD superfamily phosphatase